MQHLLDFIHEHNFEQQLYLAVQTPEGSLRLTWQRQENLDDLWQVSAADGGEPELVHCGDLLDHLEERGVDLAAFARELRGIVLTQLEVADILLRDAKQLLGPEVVQRRLFELRGSALKLSAAQDTRPSLTLLQGEAVAPSARTGKLTLVR
jgi:hypothetical protein